MGSLPPLSFTGTVGDFLFDSPFREGMTTGGASAAINLPIVAPDLTVAVTPTPATVIEGESLQYDVAVANVGSGDAYGEVTVTLFTPFDDTTIDANGWDCIDNFYAVTCTGPGPIPESGSLPPFTISGSARDDYDGQANASASVQLSGFGANNSSDDFAQVAVPVAPLVDLALSGTATGPLSVGSTGTIEWGVTNIGVGTAASDVQVSTYGSTLTDVSASGTDWSCSAFTSSANCTYLGQAGPGETLSTISYTGTAGPTNDGIIGLTGSVYHPDDQRSGNNHVQLTDAVIAPIDLTIAVESDADFTPGTTGTYPPPSAMSVPAAATTPSSSNFSRTLGSTSCRQAGPDGPAISRDAPRATSYPVVVASHRSRSPSTHAAPTAAPPSRTSRCPAAATDASTTTTSASRHSSLPWSTLQSHSIPRRHPSLSVVATPTPRR